MRHLFALLAISISLGVGPARAGEPENMTMEEINLLPAWCKSTQLIKERFKTTRFDEYMEKWGKDWYHMHHFCWAMVYQMRYDKFGISKMLKNTYAGAVVDDIDYTLRNTQTTFPFRVDMRYRKARILARHGVLDAAYKESEALIEEWPTRQEGYIIKAGVLNLMNKPQEAKQVLAQGDAVVEDKVRYEQMKNVLGLK